MCFLLRVATPLTLSEVRSMLPPDLTADLREATEVRPWRELLPETQTVVALLHGACSCDLVAPRPADAKGDDAQLRRRYRALHASRAATLRALERHARARDLRHYAPGHWPLALNRFVAEHARNAGETGYLLEYATDGRMGGWSERTGTDPLRPSDHPPTRLPVPSRHDHAWLPPDRVVIVMPKGGSRAH